MGSNAILRAARLVSAALALSLSIAVVALAQALRVLLNVSKTCLRKVTRRAIHATLPGRKIPTRKC